MKKLASLFLALVLTMGLAVPAFAVSTETVDNITITNVVRKETKTVTFSDGEKTITIHYVADITKITAPGYRGLMDYMLTDGVYELVGGEGIEGGATCMSIHGDDEVNWLHEVEGTTPLYFAFDVNAAPTEPAEPTEPTTPTDPEPEQPTEPETPVVPDAPGSYTVKKGDTWSSICTNFYGNNAQRYALQKANKFAKLAEGAVITLPEKLGNAVLIAAPVAGEGETLYTVKAGDSLSLIAKATYGDMMQYKAIFERNADRLKNANTIYEGQVIVLPAK